MMSSRLRRCKKNTRLHTHIILRIYTCVHAYNIIMYVSEKSINIFIYIIYIYNIHYYPSFIIITCTGMSVWFQTSCFWVVFFWAWWPNILRVKGHESQLKSQAWTFYMSWHNTTAHTCDAAHEAQCHKGCWVNVEGMKNMTKRQSYCHKMTYDHWKTCFPKFLAKIK